MEYFDLPMEQLLTSRLYAGDKKERMEIINRVKMEYLFDKNGKKIFKYFIKNPDVDGAVAMNELLPKLEKTTDKMEWFTAFVNYYGEHRNLDSMVNYLRDLYMKRKIYTMSQGIQTAIEKGYTPHLILTGIEKNLGELSRLNYKDTGDLSEAHAELERLKDQSEFMLADMPRFDEVSGGLTGGRVWVVGGSTGTGKSFFVQDFTTKQVLAEKKVLFFSTELDKVENFRRFASMTSYYMNMGEEEAREYLKTHDNFKLYTELRTIEEITFEIKRQQMISPIDLVVVDHLQDIEFPQKLTEYEALRGVCLRLKDISIEHNLGVILVSQMNRASTNKKFKGEVFGYSGSGKIEQIAHLAIVLQRERDEVTEELLDQVYLVIKKNRSGQTGTIWTRMKKPYFIFEEGKSDVQKTITQGQFDYLSKTGQSGQYS